MTTVSRFSRQNDAGLRTLSVGVREDLVLVLVLVLVPESKGPYLSVGFHKGLELAWIPWELTIRRTICWKIPYLPSEISVHETNVEDYKDGESRVIL